MAFPVMAAVGLGTSLLGGLFSGIGSRKQTRLAEKQLQQRKTDLNNWYAQEKNTDYLDTDAARSTLALLRRQNKRQMQALNNNAVKAGTSDEAKVAAAGRLNDSYADAVSRIAGMGTQRQDNLRRDYMNRSESLDNALFNTQMQKGQAMSDMIGTTSQAVGGLLSAYGLGGTKAKSVADTPAGRAAAARSAVSRNKLIDTIGKPTPPTPSIHVPTLSTAGIGKIDYTNDPRYRKL